MSTDHPTHPDGRSAAEPRSWAHDFTQRSEIRMIAHTTGGAFLLLGLLGFVPGITTHYGDLGVGGPGSTAKLFGFLQVSILLNLIYLAFGGAGIMGARTAVSARNYFVAGGALFGVLWVYGLLIDKSGTSNVLSVNAADSWWHLVLCLGMIAVGMVMARHTSQRSGDIGP